MRNIVLAFLFSISSIVNAQVVEINKPVQCGSIDLVLSALIAYHEKPLWIGNGDKETKLLIFVNYSTATWTLVEIEKTVACVIAVGQGFGMLSNPKEKPYL